MEEAGLDGTEETAGAEATGTSLTFCTPFSSWRCSEGSKSRGEKTSLSVGYDAAAAAATAAAAAAAIDAAILHAVDSHLFSRLAIRNGFKVPTMDK